MIMQRFLRVKLNHLLATVEEIREDLFATITTTQKKTKISIKYICMLENDEFTFIFFLHIFFIIFHLFAIYHD